MKNILMITTDQHNVNTLKMYNKSSICDTPNLDRLASDGAVFNASYCSNPVCTPARSSWQLGLFPSKTGFETNSFEIGSRTHMLPDVEYSLPRRLQKAGYQTGFTGKWHLGLPADKTKTREGSWFLDDLNKNKNLSGYHLKEIGSLPSDHGYIGDDFEGHGVGGWSYPQYQQYLIDNELELEIEDVYRGSRQGDHTSWGIITSDEKSTVESFLVSRTKEIISSFGNEKFYMQLNFWGPHEPYFVPRKNYDKFKDMEIEKPETFNMLENKVNNVLRRSEEEWEFFAKASKHYYAYVEYIDEKIGEVIDYLKENNLYESTVIIFTSDHGNYMGTHGHMENKSYGMYEDIMRVPLVIKDGEYQGIYNYLTNTCDIYETILDYANVELSECESDGKSIKSLFEGEVWDQELLVESMGAFPMVVTQRMYRNARYKYIFIFGSKEEVYDLENDPNEINNLSCDEKLLNCMRKACLEKMRVNNDPVKDMFAKYHNLDF